MRLLYSKPSPYSSKVRMAAIHCGFDLECVATDTGAEGAELLETNPAGKIPALITDEGTAVYDSRVICEYLDRLSGNLLIPQTTEGWLLSKRTEALADATAEAFMAMLYERRYRPEDKWHAPWVEKQERRGQRCLAALNAQVASLPAEPSVAHFALASNLSWIELRFAGALKDHVNLTGWLEAFYAAHPRFAEARPQA